jgi:hypothetical protein
MVRFALLYVLSLTLGSFAGCSDVGSTTDNSTGGTGGGVWVMDPAPAEKAISLGCRNDVNPNVTFHSWRLTVDPGPIVGGQPFVARLSGVAVLDEPMLDGAQEAVPGGYKRAELLGLQATVHVRSGVSADATDVVLTHEPIQRTCKYGSGGNIDPDAGSFPSCSEANDNPDGSNNDCTGLGGMPDPENVCGLFLTTPTSNECDPGGLCETKGKTGPGSQCDLNGFCVTGPVELELEATDEVYLAADSGTVLFGWDDESTGAVLDQSGDPNDASWSLPPAVFAEPGPNSIRAVLGQSIPASLDCTMGESAGTVVKRTRDALLISFPIQTR